MNAAEDRNKNVLPVITSAQQVHHYATTGTKQITVPDDVQMMAIECLAGEAWFRPGASGNLPATWPPTVDDANNAQPWERCASAYGDWRREIYVQPGEKFRLAVQADTYVQVKYY